MTMQLHYYPSTAAMIPHIVLEELGVPYERVFVDRTQGRHREPAFLRLNPNGLMPVLVDGDLVLYETAAIVLHLCDTHPQAGLAPAVGTTGRAQFYKWLLWCSSTLQPALSAYFYPERFLVGSDTWVNQRWADYDNLMKGYRVWLGDLPAETARRIAWDNGASLFGLKASP